MDYEQMYNELLKENEENKRDMKEMDEFLKGLEELDEQNNNLITALQATNSQLAQENSDAKTIQKKLQDDLNKYIMKNKEKMKDIEEYDKRLETVQAELNKVLEAKNVLDSKVVALENDNYYYMNKIRECEENITDEEHQREMILVDNIALQEDLEKLKQMHQETLKKNEEIEEARNILSARNKTLEAMTCNVIKEEETDMLGFKEGAEEEDNRKRLDEERKMTQDHETIYESVMSRILLSQESARNHLKRSSEKRKSLFEHKLSFNSPSNGSRQYNYNTLTMSKEIEIESFTFEINGTKTSNIQLLPKIKTEENDQKLSKLKKDKIGDKITEKAKDNLKEMLAKIRERKEVILIKKHSIQTKLNKHITS